MADYIEAKGQKIEIDEDGFLVNPDDWNEEVVKIFEDLGEDHWKVINYLRDYYKQFGIAPMVRKLCKDTGFSLKQIYDMFPSGPAKGACKLAGLPKPTGCV